MERYGISVLKVLLPPALYLGYSYGNLLQSPPHVSDTHNFHFLTFPENLRGRFSGASLKVPPRSWVRIQQV
jgi:hypothetical protein